jgi:D-3-phosphoglycerate dehydrogenase
MGDSFKYYLGVNMRKVLVLSSLFMAGLPKYEDLLKQKGIEIVSEVKKPRITYDELYDIVDQFDGVVVGGVDNFDERMIAKASKRVKFLVKWGVGVDNIDLQAAGKYRIAVRHSPGYLSEPVSNMVIAYIFMLARQLHLQNFDAHHGKWIKRAGLSLEGRTLGVIGVGSVGKKVITKAKAFGMNILGSDPQAIDEEFIKRYGFKVVENDELFDQSDFIALCCNLTKDNYHLLNDAAFSKMKEGVFIINTARGALVDEHVLFRAIQSGKVAGAALDVFEKEPIEPDNPLLKFDNVILSPHNAMSEDKAIEAVTKNTVDMLIEELDEIKKGHNYSGHSLKADF